MTARRQARGRRAWNAGRRAETLAALMLMAKGYRIVARRFACPAGEIDLIARRGRALVFAEVKTRADAGLAGEAISPRQRRRIGRAAEAFLKSHPGYARFDLRFDAILFGRGGWPRHVCDAWRPGH